MLLLLKVTNPLMLQVDFYCMFSYLLEKLYLLHIYDASVMVG